MPPPALVPVLAFDKGVTVSNVSVCFDASVFKSWRDGTDLGVADPKYPYWSMDLYVASWPSTSSTLLARYSGGKLVKGALYQLRGRFLLATSRHTQEPYFHIDEAIRFQGPGIIRSIKKPSFFMVGEIVSMNETDFVVSWVTKDPYRRNKLSEQSMVISIDQPLPPGGQGFINQTCAIEGSMNSAEDWVCKEIALC